MIRRAEAQDEPSLTGDLRVFFATEVLQFLQLASASGRFVAERRGERVEIAFQQGRPLLARSTGRSVRLGDVLVHRGVASRATVERRAMEQAAQPGNRLGALLVRAGEAGEDDVAAAAAEVFRRLVTCLALWADGRFEFLPGIPDAETSGDVPLDTELDRILLEGLHQADLAQAGV